MEPGTHTYPPHIGVGMTDGAHETGPGDAYVDELAKTSSFRIDFGAILQYFRTFGHISASRTRSTSDNNTNYYKLPSQGKKSWLTTVSVRISPPHVGVGVTDGAHETGPGRSRRHLCRRT